MRTRKQRAVRWFFVAFSTFALLWFALHPTWHAPNYNWSGSTWIFDPPSGPPGVEFTIDWLASSVRLIGIAVGCALFLWLLSWQIVELKHPSKPKQRTYPEVPDS